jgi:hypothetical protein
MYVILQIPAAVSSGRRDWVRRRGPTTFVSKVVIIWLRSTENNEKPLNYLRTMMTTVFNTVHIKCTPKAFATNHGCSVADP